MVKIDYAQEKTRKNDFVIPAIFLVVGIVMIFTGYWERENIATFLGETLLPALVLIIFVMICFCILIKQSKKRRDDVIRIKEKGYQIDGQILNVNTYTHTVRKSDGVYHESYYYTFVVKYIDPCNGEEVIKESIRTFTYYELLSKNCVLRLLNDEVLVEVADVAELKGHLSKKDIVLVCAFIVVMLALTLFIVIPILGTL